MEDRGPLTLEASPQVLSVDFPRREF